MNHRTRHRSPFGLAIAAPAVVKAVCGAILAVLAVVVWQQFSELAKQQDLLAPWEKVQGYAVFYPRMIGNDQQEMETGGNASSVAEARDLYPVLDRAGALFVDAANYEPGTPPDPTSRWPVPPIRVNTHYLEQYPILDAARKPITVAADDPEWVVAVPEQFKPREAQIRQLLQETRTGGPGITGATQAEQRITGDQPRFTSQRVRIVWTASGQGVFSYDPQVNPGHGNLITDPIVEIMTPANSLAVDRLNAITGGLDTGLKVRVGDDPAGTLAALGPKLKQLKLDDNLQHLVTVHQAMAAQLDQVRGGITQIAVFAGAALFVLVALTAVIVLVGSDRLRRRLTVRRLHGIGFARSYRELLIALGTTWLGQTVLAGIGLAVLAMNTLSPADTTAGPLDRLPELAAISVLSLAIEAMFVVVTARFLERRNTVNRLKEL